MSSVVLLTVLQIASAPIPAERLTHQPGTIEVIGRYREFVAEQLFLYDSSVVFSIESPRQGSLILSLTAGKDNIQIRGRFDRVDPGRFIVESAARAPSDHELYRRQAADSSRTSAELLALGKEALRRAERFDDAPLRKTARALLREGFRACRTESAGDADEDLAWVQEMATVLNDTAWALRETQDILKRRPGWERAEAFLRSIGCVQWRGRWWLEEEFMRAQGYTAVGDRWLLPRELEFAKARAVAERLLAEHKILRMHTDEYYRLRSEHGRLLVGMRREEAVAAWGFPDNVQRVAMGKALVDQWNYGSRSVYLLDGHVFQIPAEE